MIREREIINTLLIEDEDTDAASLTRCLQKAEYFDYHVKIVGTITDAKAQLCTKPLCPVVSKGCPVACSFDLILLDLRLPNGEGVALVNEIRQLAPYSALVVVTGIADDKVAVQALQAHAEEYLIKGKHSTEELQRLVRNAVVKAKSRRDGLGLDVVNEKIQSVMADCKDVR